MLEHAAAAAGADALFCVRASMRACCVRVFATSGAAAAFQFTAACTASCSPSPMAVLLFYNPCQTLTLSPVYILTLYCTAPHCHHGADSPSWPAAPPGHICTPPPGGHAGHEQPGLLPAQ